MAPWLPPPSVHTLCNAQPSGVDCTYRLTAHENTAAAMDGSSDTGLWRHGFHLGLMSSLFLSIWLSLSSSPFILKEAGCCLVSSPMERPKWQVTFTYLANTLNSPACEELNLANSHGSELGGRFLLICPWSDWDVTHNLDFSLVRDPTWEATSEATSGFSTHKHCQVTTLYCCKLQIWG